MNSIPTFDDRQIEQLFRNRVSGFVDTIKQVRSAIPRALSDVGPLPPMSPPTSPLRRSQEVGRKTLSPLGSSKPGSPTSMDEPYRWNERMFAFDRRPKVSFVCSKDLFN